MSLKKVVESDFATDQEVPFEFAYDKDDSNSTIKLVGSTDTAGVVVDENTYYNIAKFPTGEGDTTVDYDTVPYGTVITFAETENANFSTTWTMNGEAVADSQPLTTGDITVGAEGTVDEDGKIEIVFTNTRKVQKVKIHKVGDDAEDGLAGAKFSLGAAEETTITGFTDLTGLVSSDGAEGKPDLGYLPNTTDGSDPVFILPIGSYTLTEDEAPANYTGISPVTLTVDSSTNGVTVPAGTQSVSVSEKDGVYTVTVTNTRKQAKVSLKKVVSSGLASDQEVPFVFAYDKDDSNSTIKLVGSDSAEGVAVEGTTYYNIAKFPAGEGTTVNYDTVPYGTVITFTESAAPNFSTTWTMNNKPVEGSQPLTTGEITVGAEGTIADLAEGETGFDGKIEIVFTNTRKTGDFKFTKKGEEQTDATSLLQGATFTLYTDPDCTTPLTLGDSTEPVTATSGEDGIVKFTGIPLGVTFYMKETEAPAQYQLSDDDVYSVILAEQTEGEGEDQITTVVATIKKVGGDEAVTVITNPLKRVSVTLEKHGDSETGSLLEGAKFDLYNNDYADWDHENPESKPSPRKPDIVTDKDGKADLGDLPVGVYWLEETQAPLGYNPLKDAVKIEVKADETTGVVSVSYDQTIATSATKPNSDETTYTVIVINQSGVSLPSTGGVGTAIFHVGGSLLVLLAAVLLATRRRMSAGR